MLREVRVAIGDRMLRLDANGAWSVPTARDALARMDRFSIHYYEDPVQTYEEMADLRSATRASFSNHVMDLPEGRPAAGARCHRDQPQRAWRDQAGRLSSCGPASISTSPSASMRASRHRHRGLSPSLSRDGRTSASRRARRSYRWYADDVMDGSPYGPKKGVLPVPHWTRPRRYRWTTRPSGAAMKGSSKRAAFPPARGPNISVARFASADARRQ